MNKKNLFIGIWMVLMAVIVMAVAPSQPSFLLPANNTQFFDANFNLSCIASDEPQFMEFKLNESSVQNSSLTNFSMSSFGFGNYNWSCRSCNSTISSVTVDFTPTEGLITYLSLDDANTTGVVTRDLTLQDRNGTINPTVTTGVTGRNNEAFDMADGDGGINIPDDTQTRLLNGGTINMWINISALANGNRLFSKTDGLGQGQNGYSCYWDGGNSKVECYVHNQLALTSDALAGDGNYSMVTFIVADDPETFKIYVNGTDFTGATTARDLGANPSNGYNLTIGNRATTYDRAPQTAIDEVAVWNITLNQANITNLWNTSVGLFYPTSQVPTNTTECSSYAGLRNFKLINFTEADDGDIGLRLIFKNESNQENILGNIVTLDLDFDTDDTTTQSYSFSNTTSKENWTFIVSPKEAQIPSNGTVSFKASGFQQRQISLDETVNGTGIINKTLYLLPTADGIYTTFQVIDSNNQGVISGVAVTVEKLISGTYTEILSGTTDDAGSVTFWVDSNTQHRFTFVRSGYTTAVTTLTPTQSTYTQSLSATTSINETNYYEGMRYVLTPQDTILNSSTVYNFGMNLTSTYWNLTSYGITLINTSGDILIDTTASNINGSYINQTYDTTTNSRLTMYYYWNVDDGGFVNNSVSWYVGNTTQGTASLKTFFDDLKNFNKGGIDDFSKTIMYIFVIIVVLATLVYTVRDTEYVEYSILMAVIALVWLGEWIGVIPTIGEQYFLTILVGLIVGAYLITDNVR